MENGIFLGFLAWIATMMMWWHLPVSLKRASIKHFIVTDLVVGVFTVYTMTSFSKSITSMVAGTVVGLMMNFSMMLMGSMWAMNYFGLKAPPAVPRVPLRERVRARLGR